MHGGSGRSARPDACRSRHRAQAIALGLLGRGLTLEPPVNRCWLFTWPTDASADRHFNRDMALVNRFMTAQSTVATRRWGVPAIVTLAALAALAALTAAAAARQARPVPTTEATPPREAREPIMAIGSIGSQPVTFYDPDGSILPAPRSTGPPRRD